MLGYANIAQATIPPPTCDNVAATTNQDTSVNLVLPCAGYIITVPIQVAYVIVDNPVHGSISNLNADTGAVTYTPNSGYSGTDSFTYQLSVDIGPCGSDTLLTGCSSDGAETISDSNVATATITVNPAVTPTTPPSITNFTTPKIPKCGRGDCAFLTSFVVTQDARATLVVQRKYGRIAHKKCIKYNHHNNKKKRCELYEPSIQKSVDIKAGKNNLSLVWENANPGIYKAKVLVSNSQGNTMSSTSTVRVPWKKY